METVKKFIIPCSKLVNCNNCFLLKKGFCEDFKKVWTIIQKRYFSKSHKEEISKFFYYFFEELFLSLHKKTPTNFFAYALKTGDNLFKEHLKRKYEKRMFVSLFQETDESYSDTDLTEDEAFSKVVLNKLVEEEQKIIEKIFYQEVLEWLEFLEDDCAVLLLKWYTFLKEGLEQKEMAERLGLKPNTFNQKLKRCKERIQKLAEKELLGWKI